MFKKEWERKTKRDFYGVYEYLLKCRRQNWTVVCVSAFGYALFLVFPSRLFTAKSKSLPSKFSLYCVLKITTKSIWGYFERMIYTYLKNLNCSSNSSLFSCNKQHSHKWQRCERHWAIKDKYNKLTISQQLYEVDKMFRLVLYLFRFKRSRNVCDN